MLADVPTLPWPMPAPLSAGVTKKPALEGADKVAWHLFTLSDGEKSAVVSAHSESRYVAEDLARAAAEDELDMDPEMLSSTYLGVCLFDVCELV